MQVEVRVPNPKELLITGAYVQVSLPIDADAGILTVPSNVLLFRPEGTRVALVDDQGRVKLAPVKLGTDFGTAVEVLSGLKASDRLVVNPADSLADGDVVTLAPSQPSLAQVQAEGRS
jgi:multidrug efflux pump subunit AcrA (membrane-fusion protein)